MSGFLYFLPNCVDPPDLAALAKLGIGYAFEAPPAYTIKGNGSGPGGLSGMLIGCGNDLVFEPARQSWRALPAAEDPSSKIEVQKSAAWVGIWNESPPTPEELIRRKPLPGLAIALGDGREWLAPVARRWVAVGEGGWFNALPHRWGLDQAGEWGRKSVVAVHAELWGIAEWFWTSFAEALSTGVVTVFLPEAKVIGGALAALGANYRIGAIEADMLGLFQDGTAAEVLRALIDADCVLGWLKKKEAGSLTGAPAP